MPWLGQRLLWWAVCQVRQVGHLWRMLAHKVKVAGVCDASPPGPGGQWVAPAKEGKVACR